MSKPLSRANAEHEDGQRRRGERRHEVHAKDDHEQEKMVTH